MVFMVHTHTHTHLSVPCDHCMQLSWIGPAFSLHSPLHSLRTSLPCTPLARHPEPERQSLMFMELAPFSTPIQKSCPLALPDEAWNLLCWPCSQSFRLPAGLLDVVCACDLISSAPQCEEVLRSMPTWMPAITCNPALWSEVTLYKTQASLWPMHIHIWEGQAPPFFQVSTCSSSSLEPFHAALPCGGLDASLPVAQRVF